jgi:hypothetical protein
MSGRSAVDKVKAENCLESAPMRIQSRLRHTIILIACSICRLALTGEDTSISIACPAAAFSNSETQCVVTGVFADNVPRLADCIWSMNQTVLPSGTAGVKRLANGKGVLLSFTPPEVERVATLRLDIEIDKRHVTSELRVYPARWPLKFSTEHKGRSIGVFDSGSFAERLAASQIKSSDGVQVERVSTALGLSAFKGDTLLISPEEAGAGWDLNARLDARVQAGLIVILISPEHFKPSSDVEPITRRHTPPVALKIIAPEFRVDLDRSMQGLLTENYFVLPEHSGFKTLVECDNAAHSPAVIARETGSGRWIISALDSTETAAHDPAALHFLWNVIDFAFAKKGR